MGKTYRKVWAGSNSVDYHSPHNRGFAKEKKQHSHRQIRTGNRNCDEDTFKPMNHIKRKMKDHWASAYYGKIGNIPNRPDFQFTDEMLSKQYDIRWEKDEITPLDTINKALADEHVDPAFKICKKQIDRRGDLGFFCTRLAC